MRVEGKTMHAKEMQLVGLGTAAMMQAPAVAIADATAGPGHTLRDGWRRRPTTGVCPSHSTYVVVALDLLAYLQSATPHPT